MNAAYLMLTTAWLAGADPAPAVVANNNCGSGGNTCATGCDPCAKKPGLFARLFAKKCHDDCGCGSSCQSCAAPAPCCNSLRVRSGCNSCQTCREPRAPRCKPAKSCCESAPIVHTCNSCDSCGKKPLFGGLFAKKSKGDCGCGCGTASVSGCGCGGAISAPAGTGAPPEAVPVQPKPAAGTPAKTTAFPRIIAPASPIAAPF